MWPVTKRKPLLRFQGRDVGETALEDASLDLSAYYQTLENLGSWLRAHDGTEFDDLAAVLEAAGYSLDDFTQSLAAYLQATEDFGAGLSSVATGWDDLAQWLAAYFQSLDDQSLDLETCSTAYDHLASSLETWATGYLNLATPLSLYGRSLTDQPTELRAAGSQRKDLATYLAVASSTVLDFCQVVLEVTSGLVTQDLSFYLVVVESAPVFTSTSYQRVSSVLTKL